MLDRKRREAAEEATQSTPARRSGPATSAEGLRALQHMVGNASVTKLVTAQRDCKPGHHGPPILNSHFYRHVFSVCSTKEGKECTVDRVMAAARQKPAPYVEGPVSDGDTNKVPGLGPIKHEVDDEKKELKNLTLPGHRLHPGEVRQRVFQEGTDISIEYTGTGTGPYRFANEVLSLPLWRRQAQIVRAEALKPQNPPKGGDQ